MSLKHKILFEDAEQCQSPIKSIPEFINMSVWWTIDTCNKNSSFVPIDREQIPAINDS